MSSAAEERRERNRVLLLFGFTILPPLILLTILAAVAVRNDGNAIRYLEQEQALQAADRAKRALEGAILQAEQEAFAAIDTRLLRSGDLAALEESLETVRGGHPLIARLFAVTASTGDVLWPDPTLPFLREGAERESPVLAENGGTPEDFRRRADLLALYEKSVEQEEAGEVLAASRGYRTISKSGHHASATLSARASYRLGECLEVLGERDEARAAYQDAISSPLVLDTHGTPLRVLGSLRCAELALQEGELQEAAIKAGDLADDLLEGAYRGLLIERDWSRFLAGARDVLLATGLQGKSRAEHIAASEAAVQARVDWLHSIEDELNPVLLNETAAPDGATIRHHSRIDDPPLVVAYRVLPEIPGAEARWGGAILLGFKLDLDALSRDILSPACGVLNQGESAPAVAVLDARRRVQAYAGAEARPGDEQRLQDTRVPSEAVSLEPVPLWSVWVARPALELQRARSNRLWMYVALIGFTLATAIFGARSTIRYVRHSLELANMKSDFLSNITHELKTPLTSIKMYGELMSMGKVKTSEKLKEYSDHIVRESNRLQKMIEDILDFARADSGAGEKSYVLAEEDVADTVTEALDLFRASAKVRGFDLYVELPPIGKLPPVDLDRDAVVRSVLNLLANSVKYSADDRFLKVIVWREDRDWIAISVEDKGIGIDPEDLERIFDRFYRAGDVLTRTVSGAGLGLSLVDQIVQAHGGQIRVESEKGAGSLFTIMLPIVEDYRDQWPPPAQPDANGDEETDLSGSKAADAAQAAAAAEAAEEAEATAADSTQS